MFLQILLCFLFFVSCTPLYPPALTESQTSQFVPQKPTRIILVLGGGGSRGIAHLGAIQALEKAGVRPDLIIGCSAGAIVGAFYADNPDLIGTEKLFLNLKRADLLDTNYFNFRSGLVEGKKIQNFIQKNLHAQTFEDLKIPFIVVATDLFSGESVELSCGPLPSAINASCAFPGIFKPVFLNNRYLIDGGVASPLPIEIAKRYQPDLIIAIDVSENLPTSKPSHFLGIAKRSLEIAYQKLVAHSLEKADIAIKMSFQDIGMFTDEFNQQMYQEGHLQAVKMLPHIKSKLFKTEG